MNEGLIIKVEQLANGDEFYIVESDQIYECKLLGYRGMNKFEIDKDGLLTVIDGSELVIKA